MKDVWGMVNSEAAVARQTDTDIKAIIPSGALQTPSASSSLNANQC